MEGSSSASVFPNDVWGVILKCLYPVDTIFLRATDSTLHKICKQFRPFPKHHVLDQHKFVAHLVHNGFISLLDYAKDTLHFEWIPVLSLIAVRSGQVEVLEHLVKNGLAIDKTSFMFECTKHSCDLSTIKYLHENSVPWDQEVCAAEDRTGPTTVMGWMAYHGHLHCIKYAMENGCTQRAISYTPSIECLDFAINNDFDWKGETQTQKNRFGRTEKTKNICEEAARLGDLAMLKHAHEKGAPLRYSAPIANQAGHVECLMYAYEKSSDNPHPTVTKSFDCFQYLVQKLGLEEMRGISDIWFNHLHGGQLETLRFLLQNNFPFQISSPFMAKVALQRSLHSIDVFKFMLDEVKAPFDTINPYVASAEHGNLKCLELCFERNLPNKPPAELPGNDGAFSFMPATPEPLIQTLIAAAINSKNVDVLELLWKKFPNKEGLDMELCLKMAARDSVPEVLEFLTQQGAQWTSEHLAWTTVSESLPNMAYLTRIGCKWNEEECKSENTLIVKYAREHGCKHFYNEEESKG